MSFVDIFALPELVVLAFLVHLKMLQILLHSIAHQPIHQYNMASAELFQFHPMFWKSYRVLREILTIPVTLHPKDSQAISVTKVIEPAQPDTLRTVKENFVTSNIYQQEKMIFLLCLCFFEESAGHMQDLMRYTDHFLMLPKNEVFIVAYILNREVLVVFSYNKIK